MLAALQSIVFFQSRYIIGTNILPGMMRECSEGYVLVKLYRNGEPINIIVQKTIAHSPGNIPLSQHPGLWVHMIEKVYAVLRYEQQGQLLQNVPAGKSVFEHILTGGYSSDAFKILWGDNVTIIPIVSESFINKRGGNGYPYPENIDETLLLPFQQYYDDLYIIFRGLTIFSMVTYDDALGRIFNNQPSLMDDFRRKVNNTSPIVWSFFSPADLDPSGGYQKMIRLSRIREQVTIYHANLLPETQSLLFEYMGRHMPLKRGENLAIIDRYSHNQLRHYEQIARHLEGKNFICLSTDAEVSSDPGRQTGLCGRHAYTVIDYHHDEITGIRLLFLVNPTKAREIRRYGVQASRNHYYLQGPVWKVVSEEDHRQFGNHLDPIIQEIIQVRLYLAHVPGVSVIELNDLTKRFRAIYWCNWL